ncbi:glycosyltransferase, partial [Nostoc sp. NIES-2111]
SWYPKHPGDVNGFVFREQAQALSSADYRLGVITPAFRSLTTPNAMFGRFGLHEQVDLEIPTLRYHGVRLWSWHEQLNLEFWERTGLAAFKRYVARHGRPDVIHVHGMIYGLAWASAIKRRHGIPFVVTEHSTEFALGNIRPSLLAYLKIQIGHAQRSMAVSTDLATRLTDMVPSPAGWTTMPNLVKSDFGAELTPRSKPAGPLRLLNVGMLLPKKGQRQLLEALRLAVDGGLDATLRICGGGPEATALHQVSRDLKLEGRVELLGECDREQVRTEMAACDIFVLSSLYETFGVVLIEALANGKPVVATDCGGPKDIIDKGRDGLIVEKNSPHALAEGIRTVAARLESYDAIDIRARCIDRFSEATFVAKHREVYAAAADLQPMPTGGDVPW